MTAAEMTDRYQHCRPLTPDEYAALKADIEQHGVMEYVHVDENGAILVGHHRARAAAELGIEYPRHVVTGLPEKGKHEYAVRLESLGRARDIDTKRYTAKHLWDARLGIQQGHIAELVGVGADTMVEWVKAWKRADAASAAAESEIGEPNFTPPEPERAENARGQQRPTSYQPRQNATTVAEPMAPAVDPDADDEAEDDDEDASTLPPRDVEEPRGLTVETPVDPESAPVVGDVMEEIRARFDEEALAAHQALTRHMDAMVRVRIAWLRFISDNPTDAFIQGLTPPEIDAVARDLDRFIDWLTRARECAGAAKRPQRVV